MQSQELTPYMRTDPLHDSTPYTRTDLGPQGNGQGFVKCRLVDPITQDLGADIGSFSFNGQGETKLKVEPHGDLITVNHDADAAHLVLHMLNEELGKNKS